MHAYGKVSKEEKIENMEICSLVYNPYTNDGNINEEEYFNLHSKIYLINDTYAFIGSENLTK